MKHGRYNEYMWEIIAFKYSVSATFVLAFALHKRYLLLKWPSEMEGLHPTWWPSESFGSQIP